MQIVVEKQITNKHNESAWFTLTITPTVQNEITSDDTGHEPQVMGTESYGRRLIA